MQLFFKVAVLLLKNAQFMLHLGFPKELLHRLLCRPETQKCLECSDFLWNAAKEGGKNKTRQTIFKQRAFWPSVFFGHDMFYVHRLFQLSAITIVIFELLRVLASCLTTWLGILKNHWVAYCLKTLSNQSCKARLTVYCEYFSQTPASWDRLWFSKFLEHLKRADDIVAIVCPLSLDQIDEVLMVSFVTDHFSLALSGLECLKGAFISVGLYTYKVTNCEAFQVLILNTEFSRLII